MYLQMSGLHEHLLANKYNLGITVDIEWVHSMGEHDQGEKVSRAYC